MSLHSFPLSSIHLFASCPLLPCCALHFPTFPFTREGNIPSITCIIRGASLHLTPSTARTLRWLAQEVDASARQIGNGSVRTQPTHGKGTLEEKGAEVCPLGAPRAPCVKAPDRYCYPRVRVGRRLARLWRLWRRPLLARLWRLWPGDGPETARNDKANS